jgi:hypothetical protein
MTSRGKFAAVGMAAVLAVGGATVAVGQGTGGTVGPKAQGSTSFEVRIKTRDVGCDKPDVRQCFNRPKLGAVSAGSGAVYQNGARVGTAHFTNVIAKRGRNGAEMFFATVLLSDGTITLQGASLDAENAPVNNSITGGTGAYAGARGVETEKEAPGGSREEFRIAVNLTFIP